MGATYTRQSSYADGDTITAAHTNDEFNQLLAAFQASSGHTHDGTANEGGPITKLLGTSLTLGDGTSGTDITVTFDGESNDGVLIWMEDEDYFKFSDDVLINSTEKLYFNDTGTYIYSNADGDLDLVSDGTNADSIKLASSGGITLDAAGDIILDADGDDITLKNGSATYGSFTNSGGELVIKSGSTPTTAMTFSGANVTFSGTVTIGSAGISEAELEILDGATVTTTELNIIDGDTTASSTTVADADRVVFNDGGTMKQVAVTDLAAYFDDEITAMPNLVTTAATTVGALNSGSITSGFGTIDTGSSTITTTGLITGGSLDIDDVVINGTTIGHTDDTDLITLADGVATVAGEISVTTLDIGGTNVTSTAAEINLIDGGTARGTTAVASGDGILINDGGTMRMTNVDTVSTYFSSHNVGGSNIVTTGALDSGSITSGFGTIDTGSSTITTTGLISGGSLDIDDVLINGTTIGHTDDTDLITLTDGVVTVAGELDAASLDIEGDADINGTLEADAITVDGTALNEYIADTIGAMVSSNTETGIAVTYEDGDNTLDFVLGASQTTITSLLATDIKIGEDDQTKIDFETADTINFYAGNEKQLILTDGALTPGTNAILDLGTDALEFKDAYFDGTVEADAYTVAGTALDTHIAGVTVTNATNSAHVLVTDNESTDEDNLITFVEGATSSTGNVGLEMDGNLTYNPSSGTVTATIFKGNIDAVDGDFDGTLEADAITVNGTALNTVIGNESTALAIALG